MLMRLRLPELLAERGLSAYALAKRSGNRISTSTAYRLVKLNGRVQNFDADMLDALCDVLKLDSLDDLFERDDAAAPAQSSAGRSPARRGRTRGAAKRGARE